MARIQGWTCRKDSNGAPTTWKTTENDSLLGKPESSEQTEVYRCEEIYSLSTKFGKAFRSQG